MLKRNIYLSLSALCLFALVIIQSLSEEIPLSKQPFSFDIDRGQFLTSPVLIPFILFALLYGLILLIGVLHIFYFVIVKIMQKRPLFTFTPLQRFIAPSEEKASKLLFLVSFSVLLIHLTPSLLVLFNKALPAATAMVGLNMVLEIAIIVILLLHINWKAFGFRITKKTLLFVLQIYSAALPLLLTAAILNSFALEKLGIEYAPSAAIELLLSIKNPLLMAILTMQIIALGPLAEELFFRGFLFSLFRDRYRFMLSASLISFFFATIHQTPAHILPLYVIGMALCYIYEKTRSITAVAIFHALHNAISLLGFFLVKNLINP